MTIHRLLAFFISLLLFLSPISAIRSLPKEQKELVSEQQQFMEAPVYLNGPQCLPAPAAAAANSSPSCTANLVHVAMTLDGEYLRGSMAAVHSVLKHTACPENIFFHFVAAGSGTPELKRIVETSFPSLGFRVYTFDKGLVKDKISTSIRQALDNPLNYARIYLADILEACIDRVIYLDSDVVVVDDIQKLWSIPLSGTRVIGAPQYCHANFTKYFSGEFWANRELSKVFEGKRPCYFNTGVMVMDLRRWRGGNYRERIEQWMEVQREKRIYELGSLPPFLLVFGGEVEPVDHMWNQHGLGGHNVLSSCRTLHPGPVSLLHWSGKGKPWVRLDRGEPCPVDHLWAPYDLLRHSQRLQGEQ